MAKETVSKLASKIEASGYPAPKASKAKKAKVGKKKAAKKKK